MHGARKKLGPRWCWLTASHAMHKSNPKGPDHIEVAMSNHAILHATIHKKHIYHSHMLRASTDTVVGGDLAHAPMKRVRRSISFQNKVEHDIG